jgi:hypothetical protein
MRDDVSPVRAMRRTLRPAVVAATCALLGAGPAAAQIGRLPLLAPLPAAGGSCRYADLVAASLRSQGIVHSIAWTGGSPSRMIAVGMDGRGRPRHLMVLASVPDGPRRRVGESVFVMFDPSGEAFTGSRQYYTLGTPARLSEDRNGALLPGDSVDAPALARAVARRCAR